MGDGFATIRLIMTVSIGNPNVVSTELQWQVEPAVYVEPQPELPIRVSMWHWGCFAPVALAVLLIAMTLIPGISFSWLLLLPAFIVIAPAAYADFRRQFRALETNRAAVAAWQQNRLDNGAKIATSQAYAHLERGKSLVRTVNDRLEQVGAALDLSEHEFSDRAFAPFWDAIEASATVIDNVRADIDQFERAAAGYANSLRDQRHNFPPWYDTVPPVPDPRDILARFRAQVRKGQKDRDFAIILEHRLTRAVLIAGFRNFGEMIGGLESSMLASLDRLNRTVLSLK